MSTLGDCLREGGYEGRWFYDSMNVSKYQVKEINSRAGNTYMVAVWGDGEQRSTDNVALGEHLDDPEIESLRQSTDDDLGKMVPLPASFKKTLDNMGEACQTVDRDLERRGLL